MTMATSAHLARFPATRVLVMGDVMLDRYVYGRVERMSPEAPIPVLAVARETAMAGGAANVARNIAALGGRAILLGIAGDDADGRELSALLAAEPGLDARLLNATDRPTITKTRFVAERQQLLRADHERVLPLPADLATALLERFCLALADADAVILSDYGKGVLRDAVLAPAIAAARAAGKPVVADPKSRDLIRYDGVTILTPNRGEAVAATGLAIDDDAGAARAAQKILDGTPHLHAALITRGAAGMTLLARASTVLHLPAAAREVFDVSGAGDTVAATLALMLGTGAAAADAARVANLAAGIAVGKIGTAVVRPDELALALAPHAQPPTADKVMALPALLDRLARWRAAGDRVGFTNGCFDLLHPGHVALLAAARAACDRLVVGLNTDASVRRLKGAVRPVQTEQARATVMAALAAVDAVILFAEDTPLELIQALVPDVLIKGADYRIDQVVGADIVTAAGGEVRLVDLVPGQSTTNTIARMGRDAA